MAARLAKEFPPDAAAAPQEMPAGFDDPILAAIALAIELVTIFPSALQTVWHPVCPL